MSKTLVIELRNAIEKAAGGRPPEPERRYHKHENYLCYGLKAREFDNILMEFRPRFLKLPLQERLNLADHLLKERVGELSHTGIHILIISVDELSPDHFGFLDHIFEYFSSWSHVDHLCIYLLKPLLYNYRQETLELLQIWNRSTNKWKRRASVVAFVRQVGKSGEFTDQVIRMCENLVQDSDDIVRKGVGWALKDNLKSAPDRILPYIKDLRRRGVSSVITLYAIRDLKGAKRKDILALKKSSSS